MQSIAEDRAAAIGVMSNEVALSEAATPVETIQIRA
jgi:hypothetical protein